MARETIRSRTNATIDMAIPTTKRWIRRGLRPAAGGEVAGRGAVAVVIS
jgi:hypothetical protein